MGKDRTHRRSTLVAGLAAIVALAGLTALASVAVGGKKLKTKSASEEIAGGSSGGATANCSGKQKAYSGGFRSELDLNAASTPVMIPYTSRRDGKKAWRAEVLNAGSDGELTTEVYCRKSKKKLKAKTKEVTVGPVSGGVGTEATATAKCPKKQKAVSGGFENPDFTLTAPSQAVLTQESRKTGGRKWTVVGSNFGMAESQYFAQVICHKGKRLKTRSESLTLGDPASAEQGSVVAKCKRKERVVSGGFAMDRAVIEGGSLALVHASHKEGKRKWRVSGAVAAGSEVTIDAFAYCEKKKA